MSIIILLLLVISLGGWEKCFEGFGEALRYFGKILLWAVPICLAAYFLKEILSLVLFLGLVWIAAKARAQFTTKIAPIDLALWTAGTVSAVFFLLCIFG